MSVPADDRGRRIEEYRAAGLYMPDRDRSDERLELLEWLFGSGFTVAEMQARTDGLTALAADTLLRGRVRLSTAELAARLDTPVEVINDLSRAVGFSDAVAYPDSSVEAMRALLAGANLFSYDEALHFARVLGGSLSRVADAAVSLFLKDVETPLLTSGGTELELAQQNLTAIEMLSGITPMMEHLLRLHLTEAIERTRAGRDALVRDNEITIAVGFVDLVGSTSLADTLLPGDFLKILGAFEARASDLIAVHRGRLVKLIGDEAMYVATSVDAACEIALGLVESFSSDDDAVTPRGAVAFGSMLNHAGDYYGALVNLAARAAELAVPLEILVDDGVVDHAGPQFRFEGAGRRVLKGFRDPVSLSSLHRR